MLRRFKELPQRTDFADDKKYQTEGARIPPENYEEDAAKKQISERKRRTWRKNFAANIN